MSINAVSFEKEDSERIPDAHRHSRERRQQRAGAASGFGQPWRLKETPVLLNAEEVL